MPLNITTYLQYNIGDPELCKVVGVRKFWLPVIQGNPIRDTIWKYHWIDDRPASNKRVIESPNWMQSEPNGLQIERCVDAFEVSDYWNDESCLSLRCSVCRMPIVQTYYLRGPRHFDQVYSLLLNMQKKPSKIVFEGEGTSTVVWYPLKEKTILLSYKTNFTITFFKHPFGLLQQQGLLKNRWMFTNVSYLYKKLFVLLTS